MEITVKMDIKEFEEYLLFRDRDNSEEARAIVKVKQILRDIKESNPNDYNVEAICNIILRDLTK